MLKKEIFGVLMLIFLSSFISASVTCTPSSINKEFYIGENPGSQTVSCTNSDVNNSVTMNYFGGYFSLSPNTPLIFNPGENKQFTINFDSSLVGSSGGLIYFSDGSTPIPVSINAIQKITCSIDIFPQTMTNIKATQGEKKSRTIQLTVPSCMDYPVLVQGVSLQGDQKPIQLGELSLGQINPGNSVNIPIEIDATGVTVGSYSDTLQFLLYDDEGNRINVPSVSISVIISQGINPITNFSLYDLPSCSLDAINLNLNQTYKLVCSKTNPNIDIEPIIDTNFIHGVTVTDSDSQYIYNFKAVNIGNTNFKAFFKYLSANLGTPFEQEVRITNSGSNIVSGTNLKFNFYQSGIKKNSEQLISGDTIIQVVDNKTNSLVNSFNLYLDGQQINNTVNLESERTYELRATSDGYTDLVENFTVSKAEIEITLNPTQDSYMVGDIINITSNIEGISYTLDDVIINSPYTFDKTGTFLLKAYKEGYISVNKTIQVGKSVSVLKCDPSTTQKWSGKIKCELSKNSTWQVYHDSEQISSGEGNMVEFEMDGNGFYEIKNGDEQVYSRSINNEPFWKFWKWEWYYQGTLYVLLIVVVYYFIGNKSTKKSDSPFTIETK